MENGVVVPLLDLPALEKIPRATLASKADYLRFLRGYVDGNFVGFRSSEDCLFRFWVPKRSPFFSRSPLSSFQTEERDKSQSSHYLLNVDHLNTCDDKTSFNESHASLSVKLSFVLKYSNTCTCFLLCILRN